MAEWCEHPSADALAARLAQDIAGWLNEAVDARGGATLAVSGGSTPIPLFQALHDTEVPWEKVTVTLADERWVSPEHPESNEGLVRTHLAPITLLGLKNDALTPEEGQPELERALHTLHRPFDVVVLGMGTDGHTASLFPGAPELAHALSTKELCSAIHPPEAEFPRMTLTRHALLQSQRIILHITGEEKRRVYEEALRGDNVESMPIRTFLKQQAAPLLTYWAL